MKYLILIHVAPAVEALFAAMDDDERGAAYQLYWDIESDLEHTGELVDSKAVAADTQSTVTRADDGSAVVTPITGDLTVSGYYLVDVTDEARAAAIAARFPEAAVEGGIRLAQVWTQADFDAMTS